MINGPEGRGGEEIFQIVHKTINFVLVRICNDTVSIDGNCYIIFRILIGHQIIVFILFSK